MEFDLSSYKMGFLLSLFGGILLSSDQEVIVAECCDLSEMVAGQELPQPPFLLNKDWAVPCVRHSRSFRAR